MLATVNRRREIANVLELSAPQSLAFRTLPFRALASLAARSPMGGEREIVLGCFMAARLVALVADPAGADVTSTDARRERAAAARTWLAGLAMPATLRASFAKVVDASTTDDRAEIARRLTALTNLVARFLDEPAKAEMDALAQRVGG